MNALLWLGMIGFQCNESTKIRFCPDGWRHLIFDILCYSHLSCMWNACQRPPFSAIFPCKSLHGVLSRVWPHFHGVDNLIFPFFHIRSHMEVSKICQVQSSSSHGWHDLEIPHDLRNPLDTGPSPGACGIALAYDGADSTAPGMNGWKGARSQTLSDGDRLIWVND